MSAALQPTLFDRPAIGQHAPAAVLAGIHDALDYFRAHRLPFTAETVRDRLSFAVREILDKRNEDGEPIYPNVMGGVVQRLALAHRIVFDGWTIAQRDSARGRPLRRWRFVA